MLYCPFCGRQVEKKGILRKRFICRNPKCIKHNHRIIPVKQGRQRTSY